MSPRAHTTDKISATILLVPTSQTSSTTTPDLTAYPVPDELAGWVSIQSVLDTLFAFKIELAMTPESSATAVRPVTATVDAAIRELKGACRVASIVGSGGSEVALRYFDVVKVVATWPSMPTEPAPTVVTLLRRPA